MVKSPWKKLSIQQEMGCTSTLLPRSWQKKRNGSSLRNILNLMLSAVSHTFCVVFMNSGMFCSPPWFHLRPLCRYLPPSHHQRDYRLKQSNLHRYEWQRPADSPLHCRRSGRCQGPPARHGSPTQPWCAQQALPRKFREDFLERDYRAHP